MSSLILLSKLSKEPPSPEAMVIFGGTFDPIHLGHVEVIRSLLEIFSSVVLAPTTSNPWKQNKPSSLQHRAEMIRLVCRSEDIELAETIEHSGVYLDESGYVYVDDFIYRIRGHLKGQVYWAVGEDIAESVSGWRNWNSLSLIALVHPVNIDVHSSDIRDKSKSPHPAIADYCLKHGLY